MATATHLTAAERVADTLRRAHADLHSQTGLMPWPEITDTEQDRWLRLADMAAVTITPDIRRLYLRERKIR